MRKILLLTIFIIGYYLLTFSQFNGRLQIDSTFKSPSFDNNTKTFISIDSIHYNWQLNNPKNDKNFFSPKFGDKNRNSDRDTFRIIEIPNSLDNMTYLKPQGFFPMPVSKPDSTVKYTLLIKKFK